MEKYFLDGGYGNIDLRGNDFDCAIYFQGKPYAINWSDCEGSVAQLLFRTGARGYKKDLRQIKYVLENGLDESQKISEQIFPLLKLFKYGDFNLYNKQPEAWDIIDYENSDVVGYYPFGSVFVTTQPKLSLDKDVIEKYEAIIKSGKRPLIVTASVEEGWCEFVLDGHHKLQAYDRLRISPNVVNIEKHKTILSLSDGMSILKNQKGLDIYKKVKIKYDENA